MTTSVPDLGRSEMGPVLAAVAVMAGTKAGEHLSWDVPGMALIAAPPAIVLALTHRPRAGRRLAGLFLLAVLGALSMTRALAGLDGQASLLVATEAERRVSARLATDPHRRWTGARVPARLEEIDDRPARGTVLVVAKRAAAERIGLLEAGEAAVLLGHFRSLEGKERYWRWRHVVAVFDAHDLVGAKGAEPAVLRAANWLRRRVLTGSEAMGNIDRALVAGFLVGDDRGLPAEVAADFRAAGLSHLLVVSGANVALALALFAPVLQRFGLFGRMVGGLAVLVVFAAMTRFEPSVLRAATMSALALLASFVGRPVAGIRVLALAVAGLLLIDPFLVHSLGFGLSCAASAGILFLARPIASLLPGPSLIRKPLAVTTAAQIGVAPIAFPAFGQVPLVALPANLAAAPAAVALSLWGFGSGIVAGSLKVLAGTADAGPLALLQIPTALLARWIRAVAQVAAGCPVMIGPRPAALCALAVATIGWRRRRPLRTGQPPERDPAPAPASSGSPPPARGSASRPSR